MSCELDFVEFKLLFVCLFGVCAPLSVLLRCKQQCFACFGRAVVAGGGRRGFTLLLIARIILEKLTRQSGQKDGREEQGRVEVA